MSVLSPEEIERFVIDGYVHLRAAFSRQLAAECVDELWTLMEPRRDDPTTWTEPVVRIAGSAARPLTEALNTTRLTGAFDDLIGAGRWQPRIGYGTFPIRFPSERDPGDAGWHHDGSFTPSGRPESEYWVNVYSRQRALLALPLYTDVGPDDAPTRIRVGSHLDIPARLLPYGEAGTLHLGVDEPTAHRPVIDATGEAGDVFLCHPFLVHAATWPHRGTTPRFIGQPCIHHADPIDGCYTLGPTGGASSPCERAIRLALAE